jgi:hypothetical protein
MPESQSSIPTPAVANDPQAQLQDITRTPEKGDVLERLVAAGLVSLGRGLPVSEADTDRATVFADESVAPVAGAIGRVDPPKSRAVLSGGRILGMYVQDCLISTEAKPPYHRLPSFNTHFPYHIVYLLNFAASESRTVQVSLQVYSAGTVRITGTGSSASLTVGQTSIPITVPVGVKMTSQGFASILIQRVGATGFDWFAADVV